jgi:hypothetical protein
VKGKNQQCQSTTPYVKRRRTAASQHRGIAATLSRCYDTAWRRDASWAS